MKPDSENKPLEEQEEVKNVETVAEEATETAQDTQETQVADDLADKILKLNDQHLRLMAEFDNYKKRTLKERADLIKYSGERVFIDMLPIIDDFERALAHLPEEDSPLKEGIIMIHSSFVNFLKNNGVKEMDTKDKDFDMDLHEAISMFPAADESQKGKIIDCTQKGYMFHDKVIRYAKVVVAE
ncbi:MAG: nucleotide exchange factor GrpE [Paludibacteraceae bacterium]|nr:nucleotide exchange factor GrpE [Paludibacteraceae bacterium]